MSTVATHVFSAWPVTVKLNHQPSGIKYNVWTELKDCYFALSFPLSPVAQHLSPFVLPPSLCTHASLLLHFILRSSHIHINHCALSCLCSSHQSRCCSSHLNEVYLRPRFALWLLVKVLTVEHRSSLNYIHVLANCRSNWPLDLLLVGYI